MSTTMSSGMNGRLKKSLAFQLDRLDTILDGLADALNGAVADAVRQTVGEAAREAVKVALAEALPPAAVQKTLPSDHPTKRVFTQAQATAKSAVSPIKNMILSACQKVKQCCTRFTSATCLGCPISIRQGPLTFSARWYTAGYGRRRCGGIVSQGIATALVGCRNCAVYYAA